MGPLDLWATTQADMSGLGRTLSEADGDLRVPACPDWTVKDVFAHMAGVADDLLAGRLEGVATDPWTAAQVNARRDRTLAEIVHEWDAAAPGLVAALTPFGDDVDPRLVIDTWTHLQDVRAALGLAGDGDSDTARWVAEGLRRFSHSQFRRAELTPDAVTFADEESGDDTAVVVDRFEFARAATGRRSVGQLRSWSWTVADPEPYLPLVPVFASRAEDLLEPA